MRAHLCVALRPQQQTLLGAGAALIDAAHRKLVDDDPHHAQDGARFAVHEVLSGGRDLHARLLVEFGHEFDRVLQVVNLLMAIRRLHLLLVRHYLAGNLLEKLRQHDAIVQVLGKVDHLHFPPSQLGVDPVRERFHLHALPALVCDFPTRRACFCSSCHLMMLLLLLPTRALNTAFL